MGHLVQSDSYSSFTGHSSQPVEMASVSISLPGAKKTKDLKIQEFCLFLDKSVTQGTLCFENIVKNPKGQGQRPIVYRK